MAEVTQDAGHNKIPGHLAGTLEPAPFPAVPDPTLTVPAATAPAPRSTPILNPNHYGFI